MGLEMRQEHDGSRLVLVAQGEIDLATSRDLRSAIVDAFGTASEVWVDLSEIGFMDSTGLSALVVGHRVGRLVVVCPDGPARRVLEVSGLSSVLDLRRDRNGAHAG